MVPWLKEEPHDAYAIDGFAKSLAENEELEKADHLMGFDDDMLGDYDFMPQEPIVKDKKVYPNDPCTCGSGKKYKKCCGKV